MKLPYNKSQHGFSYMEIMLATFLISVALIPALESLQVAQSGSDIHQALSVQHYHLMAKVEEVLAQPYNALETASLNAGGSTAPTTYSDANGVENRRLVYLFGYDGDNADADSNPFTGVDDDLLWVRVEIEDSALRFETLTSR